MEETNSVQGRVYIAHTKPEKLITTRGILVSSVELVGSEGGRVGVGTPLFGKISHKISDGDRATIALKLDGDNFVYGISVCSYQDKFDKKLGAELATKRMNENFGCINKEKLFNFFRLYEKEKSMELNNHHASVLVLKMITNKVEKSLKNSDKYQRMIEDHRVARGELTPRSNREAVKLTKEEREAKRLAAKTKEVTSGNGSIETRNSTES